MSPQTTQHCVAGNMLPTNHGLIGPAMEENPDCRRS